MSYIGWKEGGDGRRGGLLGRIIRARLDENGRPILAYGHLLKCFLVRGGSPFAHLEVQMRGRLGRGRLVRHDMTRSNLTLKVRNLSQAVLRDSTRRLCLRYPAMKKFS
jgi:hypothetical protein